MQNEKIASIVLAVIIVVALAGFFLITYGDEIFDNLFGGKTSKTIESGDCADVNYVGKFADGTVFDTSYNNSETKTGGTPAKFFISLDSGEIPPGEYSDYRSGIEGFTEGLIGLKEGETATIGPIPPEKAYGTYPKVGDIISFLNPETGKENSIYIVDIQEDQPMPEEYISVLGDINTTIYVLKYNMYDLGDKIPLYLSWDNATTITRINETMIWMYTTPPDDLATNFTWLESPDGSSLITYWENASNVTTMNDTTIIVTHSPDIGDTMTIVTPSMFGTSTTEYTVVGITDDKINTSYLIDPSDPINLSYQEFDRTITIERNQTQVIQLDHPTAAFEQVLSIIKTYYNPDLKISFHELSGKTLYFEVEIVEIHKIT